MNISIYISSKPFLMLYLIMIESTYNTALWIYINFIIGFWLCVWDCQQNQLFRVNWKVIFPFLLKILSKKYLRNNKISKIWSFYAKRLYKSSNIKQSKIQNYHWINRSKVDLKILLNRKLFNYLPLEAHWQDSLDFVGPP